MNIAVVIPNWNGADTIVKALESLSKQTQSAEIVVVENGSTDKSIELIEANFPAVTLLKQPKNLGFAGGVNVGIKYALAQQADCVALFNNDAEADKDWLMHLAANLQTNPKVGIVTSKLLSIDGKKIDSTGECYTIWGLAYPRGRGETDINKYDDQPTILAASGGASLYRAAMLQQIGLFDERFFAYYEDVDLSWRAQLQGWQVAYEPAAVTRHKTGTTSNKIKGFRTYQTLKNLPMIGRKNVPARLLPKMLPRFFLAYSLFFWSAVARGQGWYALKGWFMALINLPRNFIQRYKIQKNRQVSVDYISKLLVHDLPPGATRLRNLRARWWKLTGRTEQHG